MRKKCASIKPKPGIVSVRIVFNDVVDAYTHHNDNNNNDNANDDVVMLMRPYHS